MSTPLFVDRPNILIIIVDEQRYPPFYENAAIKEWQRKTLTAQAFLRRHGMEFHRHYVASTGCCPSRTSLFTGQYPSLHGVTQTSGAAKQPADRDMFWLDRSTVPTMGDYFRAAGYRTFYKGKWHISDADIWVPGTHTAITSYAVDTGMPDPVKEQLYLHANRLDGYGFSDWIGPEPHGRSPRNSGSSAASGVNGRDVVFSSETVRLLHDLEWEKARLPSDEACQPWLIVASFVNPHDITLYGAISERIPFFQFHIDDSVPETDPVPTHGESLDTKPRCQASYRDVYPQAFQPITDNAFYRRLYYQLQSNVNQDIMRILDTLEASSFYEDTLVLFTADHGDLLGSHGNLHQKFYCAYEEALHVPLIMHNPLLFPEYVSTRQLTSHIDLLPTLLGLIGADPALLADQLRPSHSEVRRLVGRNLSPLILRSGKLEREGEPLYFMTEDDVTKGQHQITLWGQPYQSVIPPNRIETVIARVRDGEREEIWKYSRYYDERLLDGKKESAAFDEYELYNLTDDPLEARNLTFGAYATPQTERMRQKMAGLLEEQRKQKRLTPTPQIHFTGDYQ